MFVKLFDSIYKPSIFFALQPPRFPSFPSENRHWHLVIPRLSDYVDTENAPARVDISVGFAAVSGKAQFRCLCPLTLLQSALTGKWLRKAKNAPLTHLE